MVSLKIKGLGEVQNLFRNLPTQMQKQINAESVVFLKRVRKSAKLRAPRDTGDLAKSIIVKEKKRILEVTSPYARFQEFGFRPHWIHSDMISGSNRLNRKGFFFVKKFTPFITPAIEHNIAQFPVMLLQGTKRAINNSIK